MGWVSVDDRFPEKEGYYRCVALGFSLSIKCKFRKGKSGPRIWSPPYFVQCKTKRCPWVFFWKEVKNKGFGK